MKASIVFLLIFFAIATCMAQNTESEPNNTINECNTIVLNQTLTGQIGVSSDWYDWLKVVTPSDGELAFVGLPSAELNLFMTLFDTDGSTVLSYGKNGASGENDTLIYNSLSAGTYYLLLSQVGGGSYTLKNVFTPSPLENDAEPNNSIDQSLTLLANSSVTGHIGYYGNKSKDLYDWYKIDVATNDEITFVGVPEQSLNLFLTLYNTNGSTVLTYGKNGQQGENDTLSYSFTNQGTYYLLLTQVAHGSYTLSTTVQNPTSFINYVEPYELKTFPNPFNNGLYIQANERIKSYKLTNVLGEQKLFREISGEIMYFINTSELASGEYILSVEDKKGNYFTRKLVKRSSR